MLNVTLKPHRRCLHSGTAREQKIFAMLKVIPQPEVARRPPLAFALVIDTSGSMRGYADQKRARQEVERLGAAWTADLDDQVTINAVPLSLPTKADVVIDAARTLIEDPRLQSEDRVAVCQFNDEATALSPLAPLGDRREALAALDGLRNCNGETRMARGMACARSQLDTLPTGFARRVALLTDGRTADEPECREEAVRLARSNTPLMAAGVGVQYNEELLLEVANTTSGRSYHLPAEVAERGGPDAGAGGAIEGRHTGAMGHLHRVLDEELDLALREAVTGLVADISTVKGVRLDAITRVYPSLAEVPPDRTPYRLGNVASDDYTVFILEFTASGLERPESRAQLAQVTLAGHVLSTGRDEELAAQRLGIELTTDEAALAERDDEVRGYVDQRTIDREVRRAVSLAEHDPRQARQILQAVAGMADDIGNRDMARYVRAALDELTREGKISAESRKTISLGGRTRTIRSDQAQPLEGIPDEVLDRARGR